MNSLFLSSGWGLAAQPQWGPGGSGEPRCGRHVAMIFGQGGLALKLQSEPWSLSPSPPRNYILKAFGWIVAIFLKVANEAGGEKEWSLERRRSYRRGFRVVNCNGVFLVS